MSDLPTPLLGRAIATTNDGMDITRGYVGPLLTANDSVLRNRSGGDLVLYEAVLSDPQVKSTLAQRQLAVTQCEWQVDAASDKRVDKQAAEFLRGQLAKIGFDRVTTLMLYGVFYGYAVAELIYERVGAQIEIAQVRVRNRRRFRYDKDMQLRLLTYANMLDGIPAAQPYFWDYSVGADNDDEPYGLGLAHWLYWPVLFKRNDLKFWLIFLEKFGMPTAVGKFPAGASEPDKTKLLAATRAIQTDSGMILPEGMMLELMEAARSGTADYKDLHGAMDNVIAKVVLGQTASTEGTPGKLGNEQLQSDVRDDLIKADADLICESFNLGPARWLTEWNFPNAAPPRVYRITEAPEDKNATAERMANLRKSGFKPTLAHVEDTFGGEWTEVAAPPVPPDPTAPRAPDGAEFAEPTDEPDVPERMTPQLAARLAPVTDAWIERIRALVEQADSLEALRDGVLALAPDMSLDEYASRMQQALAAAALAGRYEITREAAS